VHVVAADGSGDRALAKGSGPAWSPDGEHIAYACRLPATMSAGRLSDLCVMNADGTNQRLLVAGDALRPQWSPDGSRILYNSSPIDLGYSIVVDAHGSNPIDIGAGSGTWAPDGNWILLVDTPAGVPELVVVRSDGSERHELGTGWNAVWSPDSRQIASTWTDGDRTWVRAIDIGDNSVTELFSDVGGIEALAWLTPRQIAYVLVDSATPDSADMSGIMLADLPGRFGGLGIAGFRAVGLTPSPDGAWLAYLVPSADDPAAYGLSTVSLDGEVVTVLDQGAVGPPSWGP
jgi:hypothetical protein